MLSFFESSDRERARQHELARRCGSANLSARSTRTRGRSACASARYSRCAPRNRAARSSACRRRPCRRRPPRRPPRPRRRSRRRRRCPSRRASRRPVEPREPAEHRERRGAVRRGRAQRRVAADRGGQAHETQDRAARLAFGGRARGRRPTADHRLAEQGRRVLVGVARRRLQGLLHLSSARTPHTHASWTHSEMRRACAVSCSRGAHTVILTELIFSARAIASSAVVPRLLASVALSVSSLLPGAKSRAGR